MDVGDLWEDACELLSDYTDGLRDDAVNARVKAVCDFLRFDLDALARPDAVSRTRITTERLNSGTITLDEARLDEGREPLSDEQKAEWQALYRGKGQAQPADVEAMVKAALTEQTQKGD